MTFRPFDPGGDLRVTRQNLPHWRQEGKTYFVTSRLADSVPGEVAEHWQSKREEWLRQHAATSVDELAEEFRLDYQRQFSDRYHELLDAGHGECVLARPEAAEILIHKMMEGQGTCFELEAWCVMPNHLHAVVTPAKGSVLGEIVQHWKGGSSFAINRLLGRSGRLWMPEPFDHILRNRTQWRRICGYIAENPREAGLREGFVLGFGRDRGLTEVAMKGRIESISGL